MSTETQTRQASCEERIDGELSDRLTTFRRFIHKSSRASEVGRHDLADRMLEREQERLLAVTSLKVYKIEYSYGGPQDYFEVQVDEDGEPVQIRYYFLDWFDGASRVLHGDEFEAAADYFQQVVYFGE